MSISEKMTALADAVRSATGETEQLSIDAMIAALGNVYPQLWGGKMIKGLLYDGETYAGVTGKLCMLVMRAATAEFNAANHPNTLGAALRLITKPHSYSSVRQCWNASGSSATMGGGTTIDSSKIAVGFQSNCVGSASFTYNWVVWRHLK